MSLFNELQKDIIENPKATWTYKRIRAEKREKKKTEKELRMEMKEKLSEKEYKKRYMKRDYEKRKATYKKKYKEKQEELRQMLEEICDELWPGNDLTDYDKFYAGKFKLDDTVNHWEKYRFAWWSSKLARIPWTWLPKQTMPFRVPNRMWMDAIIKRWMEWQHITYQYLKPLMWELWESRARINKKQQPYKHPVFIADEKLKAIAENAPFNKAYVYLMFEALSRDKYILSEMYLGRTSFIFGDVVVTETWNVFRISLDHNLPWLTRETVEDVHKARMDWWKGKTKEWPPIYMLSDAYLVKVSLKWENLFYIVPT